MRCLVLISTLALSACNQATAPAVSVSEVQPGLASCLAAIDRPDVAADPDAAMSPAEIEALVDCTADRASR